MSMSHNDIAEQLATLQMKNKNYWAAIRDVRSHCQNPTHRAIAKAPGCLSARNLLRSVKAYSDFLATGWTYDAMSTHRRRIDWLVVAAQQNFDSSDDPNAFIPMN